MRILTAACVLVVAVASRPSLAPPFFVSSEPSKRASTPQSPKTVVQIHELLVAVQRDLRGIDQKRLDVAQRKQYEHIVYLVKEVVLIGKEFRDERDMDALSLIKQAAVEVAALLWAQINGSEYGRLIDQYRSGDANSIVTSGEWTSSRLTPLQQFLLAHQSLWGRPGSPLERFGGMGLAAAVMLHTDSAVYVGMPAEHLDTARRLLAAIDDASLPAHFRQKWYLAVAGYLQGEGALLRAVAHTDEAVGGFPTDPEILTAAGALHELIASPSVDLSPLPRSERVGPLNAASAPSPLLVRLKKDGLNLAEGFYRKALTADPTFAEAHLRLGRVLHLSGRLDAALEEFRFVATAGDARIRYLASLFTGAVREANGQWADAIAVYREASRHCPSCPSAPIALSHALSRNGERDGAIRVIDAALVGKEEDLRADPWWSYPLGPFWQRDDLLAALRKAVQ